MKIEVWSIDRPVEYARNPRKITQSAIDKTAASIAEFGFKVPVIVDENGVIVAGHTRMKAAKKLGLAEVPVIIANDLTPAQIKAFRLAENRTHDESKHDFELLSIELGELRDEFDFDLALTAFDEVELSTFLASTTTEVNDSGGDDSDSNEAPTEFKEFNEKIDVEHTCPKCGYAWSGGKSGNEE